MTMMDERIVQDLTELYNDGATPGDIQNALLLDGLIQADDKQTSFATQALPGYYCGNRKAKTVMVMLNPGCDVESANHGLMEDIKRRSMKNALDIENYHEWCVNYGHKDKDRQDNFDLKQAFFFHRWKDTGIILPKDLNASSDPKTMLDAKEIVLTQKLALELIPYSSRSFSTFNPQMIHLLVTNGYVETLLDEIFSQERKYVIFCSRKFESVFNEYNKQHPNAIQFDRLNVSMGKIGNSDISGTCSVITIHYHNNKPLRAIIANTFPNQALPNAYELMEMYGEFCYKEYIK
jgi:hypothetical protein